MQQRVFFSLLMLLLGGVFAPTAHAQNTSAKGLICNNKETLPAATLVWLESTERVSSDAARGKTVSFRVRANVVVNGKVLIPFGAFAIGRIKSVVPASFNEPAKVILEVTHVRTIDDQMIAVAGDEQSFHGEGPREGFIIEQGQQFTATVTNAVEIQVK